MTVNDEAKVKAVLAVSFFIISMLIVGMFAFEAGWQAGYEEGYNQADQDWQDYLNTVWGQFVDMVWQEGYMDGFREGYLSGWVDAWNEYGTGMPFQYPHGGHVP